jgi:hypothetical protein
VDPERLDDRPKGHADLPPAPVDTLAEDFDDSAASAPASWDFARWTSLAGTGSR